MTRVLTRSDLEAGPRGTATALIPGLLPGVEAYTVKVNAKFPGARPALRGVICLHGGADGELLALLDSATVTAWRTGLAAALGTALLAPADHDVLGVIGAGAQAELTLRGLASERPPGGSSCTTPTPAGPPRSPPGTADGCWTRPARWPGRWTPSCSRPGPGPRCSPSRTPGRTALHEPRHRRTRQAGTRPGPAGRRAPRRGRIELAVRMGALAAPGLARTSADATLTDILRGAHPGRTSARQRTAYAPVGLPWQDLALAWLAWREAERRGVGATIDLLK